MSAAANAEGGPSLRDRVAEEVRVALTRRRMSGAELARQLGRSQTFVQKRLDGRQAFDIDDLEAVAHVLDVDVWTFFPGPDGGSVIRAESDETPPPRHLRIVPTALGDATVPEVAAA